MVDWSMTVELPVELGPVARLDETTPHEAPVRLCTKGTAGVAVHN